MFKNLNLDRGFEIKISSMEVGSLTTFYDFLDGRSLDWCRVGPFVKK